MAKANPEVQVEVTIKQSSDQIARAIANGIRDELNRIFSATLQEMEIEVKKMIFDAVTSQPEYTDISVGKLGIELGLIDGQSRLNAILNTWLETISVKFTKFRVGRSGLTGGIKIEAISSDYQDVLTSAESTFITEKGEELPWLQWLLLEGSNLIIGDYEIRFGAGLGRTGGGHMVNTGSWKVPSQYSGTIGNNFVTRAIDSIQSELELALQKIIERHV